MFFPDRTAHIASQVTLRLQCRLIQQVLRPFAERTAQPLRERNPESNLGPFEEVAGYMAGEHLAQDPFPLSVSQDPLTREISLGEKYKALLSDTVGFIRKLPHNLVASFRATLEEVMQSDLLLHVVDASRPRWEEQRFVVDEVLAELGAAEKPKLYVLNKIDLLSPETLAGMRERIGNLIPDAVFVSTVLEDGLEPLKRALLAARGRIGSLRRSGYPRPRGNCSRRSTGLGKY